MDGRAKGGSNTEPARGPRSASFAPQGGAASAASEVFAPEHARMLSARSDGSPFSPGIAESRGSDGFYIRVTCEVLRVECQNAFDTVDSHRRYQPRIVRLDTCHAMRNDETFPFRVHVG